MIRYTGNWVQHESNEYSASTIHSSDSEGGKASLSFVGCGIRWISVKSPQGGIASVQIDGTPISSIGLYTEQTEYMSEIFRKKDLSCSHHTITIEVKEKKNNKNSGFNVVLDAYEVLSSAL